MTWRLHAPAAHWYKSPCRLTRTNMRPAPQAGHFTSGASLGGHPNPANDNPLNQDVNSDVRAITLRRCEQRLERANETTSHRAGAAGMVAAAHSEDHGRPPGNGGHLAERGWGRPTSARFVGTWVGKPSQ